MATPFRLEPSQPRQKLQHGDTFENWELNARALSLVMLNQHGNFRYDVDLERISSSAEMLDYIFQIYQKSWGKAEMPGLLQALETIFQPQGSLCSGGGDHRIADIRSFLLERIEQPAPEYDVDD